MEKQGAILEMKVGQVIYTLPASQINIDAISAQIGEHVELKDIEVNIKISNAATDTAKVVEDTANKNNYKIIVAPIEFEITCSSENNIIEVSKFNKYVERMIALPEGINLNAITTAVVINSDGSFSHVPTAITKIDGKYYAKINSLTNSTYALINSPKTFQDVENHWAKETIDDMASRLVINGINEERFEPDMDITRAEFTRIVVNALGLMRPGTGTDIYTDVSKGAWYYDAVSIAHEYDLIFGYGDGKFGPDDKISREQAMVIISRTMQITGLKTNLSEDEMHSLLVAFKDASISAEYAKNSIAICIKAEIILGRNSNLLAPTENLTRAEVVVIARRLLQKSNLI
jgi:hypothetical protein